MPGETVLILLVAVGVTAALVGAAVALVAHFVVYRHRFPPTSSRRDETPAGAPTPAPRVPLQAADPTTSLGPAALSDEEVAPPVPVLPAREAGSVASILPEAPWDNEAVPPVQQSAQQAGAATWGLPEARWEPVATSPARSTAGEAEAAASTLPEAPWQPEGVTPAAPWPVADSEPGVSTLPGTPWDAPMPPSNQSWSKASRTGVGSNGAERHPQRANESSAAPEASNKPPPWDS